LALPATYKVSIEDYPYAVSADVAADGDGPRITSLTIDQVEGGPAVTTDGVRGLPLGRLLRLSVELAAWAPLRDKEGHPVDWDIGAASFASPDELQRAESEVAASRRRWLLTDEHLDDVARIYEANPRNAKGVRAPVVAVMEHFDISRPTAGRWVSEARKRGRLSPAKDRGGKVPSVKKARKA
jgi:hypothetical protein